MSMLIAFWIMTTFVYYSCRYFPKVWHEAIKGGIPGGSGGWRRSSPLWASGCGVNSEVQLRPISTEDIACPFFSDLSICHPTQHPAREKIRSCITTLKYFSLLKVLTADQLVGALKFSRSSRYLLLHTKTGLALFSEWPQDNRCQCLRDIFC